LIKLYHKDLKGFEMENIMPIIGAILMTVVVYGLYRMVAVDSKKSK
jgi:hypothetical protein